MRSRNDVDDDKKLGINNNYNNKLRKKSRRSKSLSSLSSVIVLLLLVATTVEGKPKSIKFVSPLHTLTIWDNSAAEDEKKSTARSRFLPKHKAGLEAEVLARQKVAQANQKRLQVEATASAKGENWSDKASRIDANRRKREQRYIENAYDKAVESYEKQKEESSSLLPPKVTENSKTYQFVGVIQQKKVVAEDDPPVIKWYARKKPRGAKWSVRLVHTDKNAIITDLFRRGKVDIYAQYDNTGKRKFQQESEGGEEQNQPPASNVPIISSKYTVKERSWRTLWNRSPKHFLGDSSGMYWRERRLKEGLYTDGNNVYESSYRYRDGRNGMHRLSTLEQYFDSKSVRDDKTKKDKILRRLRESAPDVVVEE